MLYCGSRGSYWGWPTVLPWREWWSGSSYCLARWCLPSSCVTTNHQQQTGVVVATTSHYHLSTSFLSADTSAPTPPLGLLCQTSPVQSSPDQSSPGLFHSSENWCQNIWFITQRITENYREAKLYLQIGLLCEWVLHTTATLLQPSKSDYKTYFSF